MYVTLNVPGIILHELLDIPAPPDGNNDLIGLSTIAYLSKKDPGHIFLAAARWHDACYTPGSSIQMERDASGNLTWTRWRVDNEFLKMMVDIAAGDRDLEAEATDLYHLVRRYYSGTAWQGAE